MTIKDKEDGPFDGGSTYRLTVPANAPVKQYWSATVYDRATHALIRNLSMVQPFLADSGTSRRTPTVRWTFTSGPRAPRRQGVELGSHGRRWKVRSPLPVLRPGEAAVRQDLEAAGHRED